MPAEKTWSAERRAELETRWRGGERPIQIMRAMGLTRGQLSGRVTTYNLATPHGQRLRAPGPSALRAAALGRTRYPSTVTSEGAALKPGDYQRKLGGKVIKGDWKGMPIYSLTLEERATCPTDCKLFIQCYGNNLHLAKRMVHGDGLEAKIWSELRVLAQRHRKTGFVVRLHILGDFWSVGYVELWREALEVFPGLRIFGYTAWQPETRVGAAVAALRDRHWSRFAVRTSGAPTGLRTLVVKDLTAAEIQLAEAIVCPVETGRAANCGACALCWGTTRPIAFIEH